MIDIDALPTNEVDKFVYRIILSRYPKINLFERAAGAADWDVLYAVEAITNPRLRDEVGDINLVCARRSGLRGWCLMDYGVFYSSACGWSRWAF